MEPTEEDLYYAMTDEPAFNYGAEVEVRHSLADPASEVGQRLLAGVIVWLKTGRRVGARGHVRGALQPNGSRTWPLYLVVHEGEVRADSTIGAYAEGELMHVTDAPAGPEE